MFDWVLNTPLDLASRPLKNNNRSHALQYTDLGVMLFLKLIKETIKTNHTFTMMKLRKDQNKFCKLFYQVADKQISHWLL